MEPKKKRSVYRPAPISESVLAQLEKRYGVATAELKRIAKEMRFGRPKLEMHLIYLTSEARRRTQ